MRYRKLDANGDYSFGQGTANFLINVPATVGQSVLTRLELWEGEWFLDTTEGTPWLQSVLGKNKAPLYDIAIRQRILDTQGVVRITEYSSTLDSVARSLAITATIDTVYGETTFSTVLQAN